MVSEDRFQISTTNVPYIRICDFVLKALGNLAPKSVVSAFGINVESIYVPPNIDARNELGTRLAPPLAWGSWGKTLLANMQGEHKGTHLQGGLMHLQMRQPFIENGISGWRDAVIAPSPKIENKTAVLLRTNHHHQISKLDPSDNVDISENETTSRLLTCLPAVFEKSIADSLSIFEGVVTS